MSNCHTDTCSDQHTVAFVNSYIDADLRAFTDRDGVANVDGAAYSDSYVHSSTDRYTDADSIAIAHRDRAACDISDVASRSLYQRYVGRD